MNGTLISTSAIAASFLCLGCSSLFDPPANNQVPRFSSEVLKSCSYRGGNAVIRTSDNSILIAGAEGLSNHSVFLQKLSSSGKLLWERTIDSLQSASGPQVGHLVLESKDGGYLVSGYQDYSQFAKVDSLGEYQWGVNLAQYQPGNSGLHKAPFKTISNGQDGNVLVLAYLGEELRQVHLNPSGIVVKVDSARVGFTIGAARYSDDGVWVVGVSTDSTVDSSHVSFSALKFDWNLGLKARKDFSIPEDFPARYRNAYRMSFYLLSPAPDGGFVVLGRGEEKLSLGGIISSQTLELIQLRVDGQRALVTAKLLPSDQNREMKAIHVTSAREHMVIGTIGKGSHGDDDGYIAKYGPKGDLLWEKDYGGPLSDFFHNAHGSPDQRILLIGGSMSYPNKCKHSFNPFLLKIDEDGKVVR